MITLAARFPEHVSDKSFRSYAELLRWIAASHQEAGHIRSAESYPLGWRNPDDPGQAGYSLWRLNERLTWHKVTTEQWERLVDLQKRYRSYCHYRREVEPDWRDGERTYWADNSVTRVQVSARYGVTRTVTEVAPHGDLC